MAAIGGINLLDKARKKFEEPKLWLAHREFLLDEQNRLDQNIRYDRYVSVLLSVAIAGVGLYAAPYFSAGLKIACLAVTGVVICVLQLHDHRKISQLKQTRDSQAAQLGDLPRD
jgi:hypothetical protein